MKKPLQQQDDIREKWDSKMAPPGDLSIEPWTSDCDSSSFSSGMASIDRYIKEQAPRDTSSRTSVIFVLAEKGQNIVRGYYTLSAMSIVFDDLPRAIQRKLPRYPQMPATLLGRLGVDRHFSRASLKTIGEKPRLGEMLLVNAQMRVLQGAKTSSGSALMIVDALIPTEEELTSGLRDPISFYTQYGFAPFPGNNRRVFKLTRTIEQEFSKAGLS